MNESPARTIDLESLAPLERPDPQPLSPGAVVALRLYRLCAKVGIPPALALGFLGLLLFMIGDGVESGFIAPFIVHHGAGLKQNAAYLITGYGVAAAAASWLAAALSRVFGPRRVMAFGFVVWLVFDIVFLAGAMSHDFVVMAVGYSLRGFGYPLFAYAFLVWVTAVTPTRRLGTAVGWFYFAFTGGFPTLGSLLASVAIPLFGAGNSDVGQLWTLWLALGVLTAGALLVLLGVRERTGAGPLAEPGEKPLHSLLSSVTVGWRHPRVLAGALVRMINTTPEYALLVLFPTVYIKLLGNGDEIAGNQKWLLLVAVIFGTNVFGNLLFGSLSDWIGWRPTIAWFGAAGSAVTFLALYFVPPLLGPERFWLILIVGALFGATLGAFVPTSALVPQLAPENRAGALAMLNLGAGASVFVGPGIVSLYLVVFGSTEQGRIWTVLTLAALYVLAIPLVSLLRTPEEVADRKAQRQAARGSALRS